MSADAATLYRIHGLLVESEIPLHAATVDADAEGPGTDPRSGSAAEPTPDYRIMTGEPRDCPPSPPPGRILAELRDDGFASWATEARRDPGRRTLRYAGICDVMLDRGRRTIIVHRAFEADPALIPIFLEGNVLAHALAADDLLVLHASAVQIGDRALAIVGPSGTGKSTLAALLCSVGARLVTDDALRVDATNVGAVCFPGTHGLRLRPAAASLEREIEGAGVQGTVDGRTKVLPTRRADAPLKLEAALVPEPSREAHELQVRRLGAMAALQELLRHPRLTVWRAPEPIGRLFELTAEIAPALRVYRARVPWGPPFPPGLAEELLASVGLGSASAQEGAEPGHVAVSGRQARV